MGSSSSDEDDIVGLLLWAAIALGRVGKLGIWHLWSEILVDR